MTSRLAFCSCFFKSAKVCFSGMSVARARLILLFQWFDNGMTAIGIKK
jgi:hypothetical protein